ncbi:GAF domain-containing protein [Mycolicibacterium austroafricanum]|uniref:GAF domain-containing protein n=1 Tax=Mycolicibacterium austroafricanum TaxID=39687 RepID=A0ABT8HET3_MYCAO|nr:GAF domain-containing protein [Mycolicibacterium austroafricanum]MDN4519266.1 GAF domain-containing protein [Mycolicibacterium austroafricanum]QRZ06815.1 GAF domain-containing protein [Mycolicibacterium austroafricanum]QZT68300.1 GAF domain-containing protein [Mycolicibacterium austroafricanum]
MSSRTLSTALPFEHWLSALAEIGEAVGGDEPVAEVLDRVARTACTLLGYDFCAVLLPDEQGRALTIEGSYGLSADYIAQVNANRPILLDVRGDHEAPTSLAYRTGDVVTLEDIELVPDFTWGGVAQEQGYRALISAPLRRPGTVVGALNGYRTAPHRFDRAEVSLVTTLATQVAIALGTAQLRAKEQATIRELRRAEEVHTLLTATALRGEGVSGVAAALSELLGRGVLIEDVYDEPLTDANWTGPDPRAQDHVVATVTLDGSPVARIHVAASDSELSRLDVRAVEHATVVTALELLRARTAAEVEQRIRGSLVADLLSSDDAGIPALLDRARRLGWDLSGVQSLIALRPADERTLAAADRFIAGVTPHPLVALHRGDLVFVWPSDTGPAVPVAHRLLEFLNAATIPEAPRLRCRVRPPHGNCPGSSVRSGAPSTSPATATPRPSSTSTNPPSTTCCCNSTTRPGSATSRPRCSVPPWTTTAHARPSCCTPSVYFSSTVWTGAPPRRRSICIPTRSRSASADSKNSPG